MVGFYYNELLEIYDYETIVNAGYFEESNSEYVHDTIIRKYSDNTIILYTTGAFSPIHNGHINMLIEAKDHYEKLGNNVKAIIIPDSNEYTKTKYNGTAHLDLFHRMNMINIAIEKYDWIECYSKCSNNHSINFTTFFEECLVTNNKVVYVCGEDNKSFEKLNEVGFNVYCSKRGEESSTKVRNGDKSIIDEKVKKYYENI